MRTQLRLFSLIAAMVLPIAIWANVIVKGHVTYQNGQPANNYKVYIQTDSSSTACLATHVQYTNPNGVYQDTLVCSTRIVHVKVWVVDCQNNLVTRYLETTSSNIVETNFVVCAVGTCNADFTWYPISGEISTVRFHSETSTAGSGDSIVSRKWLYGDGDSASGNSIAPDHHYLHAGNYTVCLYIKTKNGCESHICKTINVAEAPHNCHAAFTYLPTNIFGNIHFNGQPSIAGTGDSIIQYKWKFGDGGTASTKDPFHTYTKAGNYTVCLTVTSKSGCIDSTCQTIVVEASHNCHAAFTYLPTNVFGNIHFNGQPSTGDSIIQYRWAFGDGGTASTKDPYHNYTKAANYLACLTIVTKNGCTDSTCTNIVIAAPPPTTCSANFNFTDTGLNGHFNSSQINVSVGDSIINRYWNFGDGQTLSGNTASPLHHYKYGGNYQVCLKVTTRLGCVSEVCKLVHISGDSIVPHVDLLKIISVYPNPATTQFSVIIASRYNNVDATLEIYDVYGTLKWSSKKVLSQGNNTIVIPISQLLSGPYIFKVTTIYGVDSKRFFKL